MAEARLPAVVEAAYFLLSLAWLLYRPFKVGFAFFIGINGLLVATLVWLGDSKEAYSVWCWQAVFIYLFVIFEPYVLGPHPAKGAKAE